MRADKEQILYYKSFNAAVILREASELETFFSIMWPKFNLFALSN